ncbi:MAG: hypothetical protein K6G56_02150 [Clostridiales bacterium]|nr:hypothetical protein [Clostridiales bacterium]
MLKALMKKELSQFLHFYMADSRKKKKRTRGAAALYLALIAFAFVSLGLMFYGMATTLQTAVAGSGAEWVYYSIMGVTAVLVGVIGSVFTANAILYKAKDNELLLSMPIPPRTILFVRMFVVFISSLLTVALVWIPAVLRIWIAVGASAREVIMQVVTLIVLSCLVTVLNCLLGWLVALLSRRVRNKTVATVILSLLFVGLYYLFYFNVKKILDYIILNLDRIAELFRGKAYPLYLMGSGAAGNVLNGLLFALAVFALFAAACAVLSATLIRILTASNAGVKRAVYREKRERQASAASALLRKEAKRFTGSAVYMLNDGFGILLMLLGAVILPFTAKSFVDPLRQTLETFGLVHAADFLPALICCMISGMDLISAASVSMEGKYVWIVRSMPVSESEALRAKLRFHLLVNGVPALILGVVGGIVLKLSPVVIAVSCLTTAAHIWLIGGFGLMLNVKKPNLDWTNEAVPVKQGMPVLLTMLLGLALIIVFGAAAIILGSFMPAAVVLLILAALYGFFALLIERWILRRGAKIFAELG